MSASFRKEVRVLFPACIVAAVVALCPLFFRTYDGTVSESLLLTCFGVAALFLGLTPFGQELIWGTFGLLLAQPLRRERIFWVKAGLLAAALFCGWAVLNVCWSRWTGTPHPVGAPFGNPMSPGQMAALSGVLSLVAFSGGLWTTLLLRDVAASLFATILVPVFIYGGTVTALAKITTSAEEIAFYVLVAYAVGGVMLARRLFMGAQDLPWTGGQISLTDGKGKRFRWLAFGFQKQQNKWVALIYKELQLHEITMVLVPILVVLHLLTMAVRHFVTLPNEVKECLDFIGFIWVVVPLVIGCVPVAEERRHNTWVNALCLPAVWRGQLAVKFGVTMVLGTLLGGVLPALLEEGSGPTGFIHVLPIVALAITAAAFLASTMSRGLLQSFTVGGLLSIAVLVAFALFARVFLSAMNSNVVQNSGKLFPMLLWLAGIAVYVFLVFQNSRQLQPGLKLWLRNLGWLCAVPIFTLSVTAGIYDRVWEFAIPLEPGHGPARLTGSGRPVIAGGNMYGYAVLPDGRLWEGYFSSHQRSLSGHFADGTNWVDVAASSQIRDITALGLKSDGTLWQFIHTGEPSQFGTDSDWKKVIGGNGWFLGLKQNGQVWVFSTALKWVMEGEEEEPRNRLSSGEPKSLDSIRLGDGSDWASLSILGFNEAGLVKNDGTLWAWAPSYRTGGVAVPNQLFRLPDFGPGFGAKRLAAVATFFGRRLAVRDDGTLWSGESKVGQSYRGVNTWQAGSPITQVGTKADWLSVSGAGAYGVALEADGNFWALRNDRAFLLLGGQIGDLPGLLQIERKQPSRYYDWLAVADNTSLIWALARDGTISCWVDPFRENPFDPFDHSDRQGREPWIRLSASRAPVASVNIFATK